VREPVPSCTTRIVRHVPGSALVGAPSVRFPPSVTTPVRKVDQSTAIVAASVRVTSSEAVSITAGVISTLAAPAQMLAAVASLSLAAGTVPEVSCVADMPVIEAPGPLKPVLAVIVVPLTVVPVIAAAEAPPITAPSIVPPLMSTVVTAPPFATVAPVNVIVPEAVRFVKVAAAADAPPITTPSAVPPLMSVVVSTELASVTMPVVFAILPADEPSLALRVVTSMLVVSTVVALQL
jgi:hypothetical protein